MESEIFKKIEFEDLFDFLDKNFYKISKIGVFRRGSVKVAMYDSYEGISIRRFFESEFEDSFIDVYNKIYDFVMEKLKNDGFYLVDTDDRYHKAVVYKFIKFCEKHEDIKKLYILFENDEYKLEKVMEEKMNDFFRCENCEHFFLMIEDFEGGINFEFI